MLTGLIEQMLADAAPCRGRPAQPDCVQPLDLDNPETAQALDPQDLPADGRQRPVLVRRR